MIFVFFAFFGGAFGILNNLPDLSLTEAELTQFVAQLLAAEDPAVYQAAQIRWQDHRDRYTQNNNQPASP